MRRVVVDTPQSRWTEGVVYGLGDPLEKARVLGRPLSAWRQGWEPPPAQAAPTEPLLGPALVVGADTFSNPFLERAFLVAAQRQTTAVRLARAPGGPGGLADPLSRLPRDDVGRLLFDLWAVPAGVRFNPWDDDEREKASPLDVDLRTRTLPLPADPEVTGGVELALKIAGGVCGPVGHWAEVVRMNLLATGGQLMDVPPGRALLRYLWAGLRAGSLSLTKAGRKLNRVGRRCSIHPSAVVELSVLGDGVRVGPGAVVRGSFLGDGVHIGAQALCELTTVMEGAEIQRQAMVNVSTVYPHARVGGTVQLGLCGERSAQKMYAVGTDMRLGGKARVMTPDGLRDVDIGYLGVCFGHRSFVGSGVWIGAGRVVPKDARIVRPASQMVLKPEDHVVG